MLSRGLVWQDHGHCRREFVNWREIYNHEHPHASLDNAVPASRHEISARQLPARHQEAGEWYGGDDVVRKVLSKGIICFRNVLWSIGEAFKGQEVALRRVGYATRYTTAGSGSGWRTSRGTANPERRVMRRWRTGGWAGRRNHEPPAGGSWLRT